MKYNLTQIAPSLADYKCSDHLLDYFVNRFCLFIVMNVLVIKKCPLSSNTYLLHMMRSVKMFMHLTSLCIKKKIP